ncbi:MAG: hypothetical protein HQK66_15115 [Desulfamplus sp.]|nr:hypothetical protein [Desulfamplus sp.]
MKIYVCVKHVPDSAANIVLHDERNIEENITFLMNPYDEYAVTEAVSLKKSLKQGEVIAVCLGKKDAEKTLRSAMAMGADRGILIETDQLWDSITTARALKSAIEDDGTPGIIFTGRESIDMAGMQTMFRLGALFDFPAANNVVKFTPDFTQASSNVAHASTDTRHLPSNAAQASTDTRHLPSNAAHASTDTRHLPSDAVHAYPFSRVIVETLTEASGRDIYQLSIPCVLGAGRGLNTPSYPTFPDVVKSKKKPLKILDMESLNFERPQCSTRILGLELFAQKREPREIKGDLSTKVDTLVKILKDEAKIL